MDDTAASLDAWQGEYGTKQENAWGEPPVGWADPLNAEAERIRERLLARLDQQRREAMANTVEALRSLLGTTAGAILNHDDDETAVLVQGMVKQLDALRRLTHTEPGYLTITPEMGPVTLTARYTDDGQVQLFAEWKGTEVTFPPGHPTAHLEVKARGQ